MTTIATRHFRSIEPEHIVWLLSRAALLVGLVFLPILVFAPGLTFWVDLLQVIPIMWMGGMCSESMMIRIVMTLFNIGTITVALSAARMLTHKLRFSFDQKKHGARGRLMELPGPTVWQARLDEVHLGSVTKPRFGSKLFGARQARKG